MHDGVHVLAAINLWRWDHVGQCAAMGPFTGITEPQCFIHDILSSVTSALHEEYTIVVPDIIPDRGISEDICDHKVGTVPWKAFASCIRIHCKKIHINIANDDFITSSQTYAVYKCSACKCPLLLIELICSRLFWQIDNGHPYVPILQSGKTLMISQASVMDYYLISNRCLRHCLLSNFKGCRSVTCVACLFFQTHTHGNAVCNIQLTAFGQS